MAESRACQTHRQSYLLTSCRTREVLLDLFSLFLVVIGLKDKNDSV